MSQIPFPGGAADQDVFFHEDKVCVYHKAINTWECRTVERGMAAGQPAAVTTRTVYTIPLTAQADAVPPDLPDLRTQYDVNWYLSYHVLENKKDIEHIIWVGDEAPAPEHEQRHYLFWFNTDELALYVWNEGAWFPVSGLAEGGVSTETFTYTIGQVQRLIDEVYLKNIDQDNRLDVLEENIGELEEEIDALAPSNERGEWTFNPLGVASPGNYAFLDGGTQPTDRFDGAAIIYVSTRDADNVTHSFNNHKIGEYLQIFNKDDDGYGLYQITDIDDNSTSPNPFFAFTVDFVRSLVTEPKAKGRGRFKFFTIAEGDPGAYVLKTGDEMTGDLKVDGDILATGKYLGGHYNGSTFNTFPASVEIIENSGMLNYGSRRCMFWNDNGGVLTYGNKSIFGWSENNSTAFKPIKIYDTSLVVDDNHVIHKGYVDEQIAEVKENTPTGRVIITPLEFANLSHSYYANDDQIKGINKYGSYTSDREVYGLQIPWAWFAKHHPEIIGFIETSEDGVFQGRPASITVDKGETRPGITIKQSENYANYPTVTIPGFHVPVDDISEDQYTHKFEAAS